MRIEEYAYNHRLTTSTPVEDVIKEIYATNDIISSIAFNNLLIHLYKDKYDTLERRNFIEQYIKYRPTEEQSYTKKKDFSLGCNIKALNDNDISTELENNNDLNTQLNMYSYYLGKDLTSKEIKEFLDALSGIDSALAIKSTQDKLINSTSLMKIYENALDGEYGKVNYNDLMFIASYGVVKEGKYKLIGYIAKSKECYYKLTTGFIFQDIIPTQKGNLIGNKTFKDNCLKITITMHGDLIQNIVILPNNSSYLLSRDKILVLRLDDLETIKQ